MNYKKKNYQKNNTLIIKYKCNIKSMIPEFGSFRLGLSLVFVRFIRLYHINVLDHYENPRNVGKLNKLDSNVGTGLVGAPACGDVMKLQIRVDPLTNRIIETKFKTFVVVLLLPVALMPLK